MKYAYDKGFKKAAINLPFRGLICKLSHKPLEKILEKVKIPTDVEIHDFVIEGCGNEQIRIKEIVPVVHLLQMCVIWHRRKVCQCHFARC